MSAHVIYCLVSFVVILTHSKIVSVKCQCTVHSVQGCDSVHASVSIIEEMQQQNAMEFGQLNKQVQSIHGLLEESVQQLMAVGRSLQVGVRPQEHVTDIKHDTWNSRNLANYVWDCSDIRANGQTTSGVYEVCVRHRRLRICANAFCDMETGNSSSMVFQRRVNGRVDFYRTWTEYEEGFGDLNGEFWLGNEMLYLLTSKRNYKLRIDLEDFDGGRRYVEYDRFSISSPSDYYRLSVGGYSGDAGDSLMSKHDGQQFTTKDVDNDRLNGSSCARQYRGAWWYNSCYYSNLNGKYMYHRGNYSGYGKFGEGIVWHTWLGDWYSLKSTQMKLVPLG